MPLYTVRCRMQVLAPYTRGASFVEMTHHLHWDDDTAALDAFPNLITHWNNKDEDIPGPAVASRWCVEKDQRVHELALYRRSIEDRKSWAPLAKDLFSVAGWSDIPAPTVVINGIPLDFDAREAPFNATTRQAVLVRETTSNPLVSRRVYVGPLSPVCSIAKLTIGIEVPYTVMWLGPNGDYPFDPDSDNLDDWRDSIRDIARDHCADVEDFAGDGYSVVPSWTHNLILPVLETRASSVRAELRSRAIRGAMSDPAD